MNATELDARVDWMRKRGVSVLTESGVTIQLLGQEEPGLAPARVAAPAEVTERDKLRDRYGPLPARRGGGVTP